MSYQQEIENIHTGLKDLHEELKEIARSLESQNNSDDVRYEYKVVTLEEETGSSLAEVLNYWSVTGNWYYAESLYLDEQWVIVLERKVDA